MPKKSPVPGWKHPLLVAIAMPRRHTSHHRICVKISTNDCSGYDEDDEEEAINAQYDHRRKFRDSLVYVNLDTNGTAIAISLMI